MISIKRADWREALPRARYCQASGLRFGGRFGTVQLELLTAHGAYLSLPADLIFTAMAGKMPLLSTFSNTIFNFSEI